MGSGYVRYSIHSSNPLRLIIEKYVWCTNYRWLANGSTRSPSTVAHSREERLPSKIHTVSVQWKYRTDIESWSGWWSEILLFYYCKFGIDYSRTLRVHYWISALNVWLVVREKLFLGFAALNCRVFKDSDCLQGKIYLTCISMKTRLLENSSSTVVHYWISTFDKWLLVREKLFLGYCST